MKKITKHIIMLDIIIGLLFFVLNSEKLSGARVSFILCLGLLYTIFFIDVVKIIYNRRKIVEKSSYPVILLIINVFAINVFLLSLIVWELNIYRPGCFKGINSIGDAVYFTIVSFSTVGYGDILPVSGIAKGIVVLTICSNIMLLVVFVNFFIMRSNKKEKYINGIIWKMFFMFEQISSECGIIDKKYEKDEHTWLEWIDIFINILQKNMDENPERFEEINNLLKVDRDYNRTLKAEESMREIPYRYINGQDEMLIRDFVNNCQKVIYEIESLERDKIILLENENLTENIFFTLTYIKQDLTVICEDFRYDRPVALEMMRAWKNDLRKYMDKLGYGNLADIPFYGYNIEKSEKLILALNGINFEDSKYMFWLRVNSFIQSIMKI